MLVSRRIINGLAKWMAFAGGAILVGLIVTTCLSIIGRSLNTIGNTGLQFAEFFQQFGPITGDFELMEMGIGLSIFLFLPWCQLNRGHAKIDVFTIRFLSERANEILEFFWEFVLVIILAIITIQLFRGMADKMLYREVTFLLQWPVWWAYAACGLASLLATIVGLYSLALQIKIVGGKHHNERDVAS